MKEINGSLSKEWSLSNATLHVLFPETGEQEKYNSLRRNDDKIFLRNCNGQIEYGNLVQWSTEKKGPHERGNSDDNQH